MSRKTTATVCVAPSFSAVKPKRGRPQNCYSPESLLPFRQSEVLPLEKFERQCKQKTGLRSVNKSIRKRPTNPATSIKDYSFDEVEFMNALSEYKRNSGHVFPTCCEILGVLRELGYEKKE